MQVLNKYVSEDGINIMRGTIFGNPFIIGKHGTREEVVKKYEAWVLRQPAFFIQRIKNELKGKNLVCCCSPKACHGDVLLKIANG